MASEVEIRCAVLLEVLRTLREVSSCDYRTTERADFELITSQVDDIVAGRFDWTKPFLIPPPRIIAKSRKPIAKYQFPFPGSGVMR